MMRALAIAIVLIGCSTDVELEGTYRVDLEVRSSPCGADEPVLRGEIYLQFTRGEVFGTPYYVYQRCADADATDCASVGGLFEGFFEPIDGGWLGNSTYASTSGRNCSLGMMEQTAILDGDRLVVERHTFAEGLDLPVAACTPEEAERRGEAMPCMDHQRIDAIRL